MKLQFDLNRDEIFEKFLNGELSKEEHQQVIDAINNDNRLKEEFLATKEIYAYYNNERKSILINTLKEIEKESNTIPVRSKRSRLIRLKQFTTIAACLMGIIFLGKFLSDPEYTNKDLYSQHFEAYPNVYNPTVRSNQSNLADIDSQIMNFYEKSEYQKSVDLYNSHYNFTEQENELNFYMAISYMKLNEISKAKEILISIPKESKYFEKSKWYLSLCYLNENNLAEFAQIANTLIYKKDIADEITKELQ